MMIFLDLQCPCNFRQNQSCRFAHFECNSWPLTLVICTDQSVTPQARAHNSPLKPRFTCCTTCSHFKTIQLIILFVYGNYMFVRFLLLFCIEFLFWNRIIPTSGNISQRNFSSTSETPSLKSCHLNIVHLISFDSARCCELQNIGKKVTPAESRIQFDTAFNITILDKLLSLK